jgi:hypothetical protein
MQVDDIVRNLAAGGPYLDEEHGSCALCGAFGCLKDDCGRTQSKLARAAIPRLHAPECPWRLAKEAVDGVDPETRAYYEAPRVAELSLPCAPHGRQKPCPDCWSTIARDETREESQSGGAARWFLMTAEQQLSARAAVRGQRLAEQPA